MMMSLIKTIMASSSSIIILLSFMVATTIPSALCQMSEKPFTTTLDDLCKTTLYPKECINSLSPLISNTKNAYDSQLLYNLSVHVSMDEISKLSDSFSNGSLRQIFEKSNDANLLSRALSCLELFSQALYNLNESLPEVGSDNNNNNALTSRDDRLTLRTRITSAGAYLETVIDEFEHAPEQVRDSVIKSLDYASKLVSNTLAIMCKIDESMSSPETNPLSSRKIDQWPAWLSIKDRKLLYKSKQAMNPDAVVAQDGSGNFTRIGDALDAAPSKSNKRFVIYVKRGVYNETVRVQKQKWNVMMYGDGRVDTVVSGKLSNGTGTGTFNTSTFGVFGKGFIARDMGFINTAGPKNGQAVALFSGSDQSVFYRCRIDAYQDSLYAHSHRQFYRECDILGTVDYIFGYAAVVIQKSNIRSKKPLPGQNNVITAQGKTDAKCNTGISIQSCDILAAEDLTGVKTFLGRPWRNYSTVVFMESKLDSLIDPKGWRPLSGKDDPPDTILYVEYNNFGPGSDTRDRVKWAGVKVDNTEDLARKFTVRQFIKGDQWLPGTGVEFDPDL